MISVIIPLYNKETSIAQTLECVLSQSYKDFEVVVVDDGSKDGSVVIVEQCTDPRIRLIKQNNGGVSVARNRGIQEAKGKYIAFLDADDVWDKNYLYTIAGLIRKYSDCAVFATRYKTCDVLGVEKNIVLNKWTDMTDAIMDNYFEIASISSPPLWTSAVCVSKRALEDVGLFPVGVISGEDLLTWARLAIKNKIAYSNLTLATFNVEYEKVTDRPKRVPTEVDYVGEELVNLYRKYKSVNGLRTYISNWKKMRSSNYMRLGLRLKSIKEALISLWYNPFNYKLYLYLVYNLIPHK